MIPADFLEALFAPLTEQQAKTARLIEQLAELNAEFKAENDEAEK